MTLADADPAQMLAAAARVLAREGHYGGLAGQVTARTGPDGRHLTLPLGVAFDEVLPRHIVEADADLSLRSGAMKPNPANRFHVWIYRVRPDVGAIVHTHPHAASALSMLGVPLLVGHMDATPFFEDCAFLAEWPGLPVGDSEGEIISAALGDKHSAVLAHHGLITVGPTLAEALYRAVYLDRAAALQLSAMAAGEPRPVPAELAREARDFLLKPFVVEATVSAWIRRELRDADFAAAAPGLAAACALKEDTR